MGQSVPWRPTPEFASPYSLGDGSAIDKAVYLEGSRTEAEAEQSEERWIELHRKGWHLAGRQRITEGCKDYDRITIVDPAGTSAAVFFFLGGCFWRLDPAPE